MTSSIGYDPHEYPAIFGLPVTPAQINKCLESGHVTWTVDDVESSICPRCGANLDAKRAAAIVLDSLTRKTLLSLKYGGAHAEDLGGGRMSVSGFRSWDGAAKQFMLTITDVSDMPDA